MKIKPRDHTCTRVQPNPKPHTNSEMDSKTILVKNKVLTLTEDEFDVLHDLVSDTVQEIYEALGELNDDELTLNDYEIYQVFNKLNRLEEQS